MHPTVAATWKMIAEAAEGMSVDELARHAEGKWSAAEILEHLLITYTATTAGLRKALAKGRPLGSRPTPKQRLFQTVVLDVGYFPHGRQAPAMTLPKGLEPAHVLRAVEQALPDMDAAIAQCEEKYGKGTKVADHPVLGPLTAQQWRKFHFVHARHHMKQVMALRGGATARSAANG
jgi:hypothetical protein